MRKVLGKSGKRIMAAALAAVLGLSLTACQSSANQTAENNAGQEENVQAGEEGIEQVTIDIFMDSAGENPITAGIQDDPVAQYIKEQTGVTLNVVLFSNEKQQAMAASGDLYDVNRMGLQYITPVSYTHLPVGPGVEGIIIGKCIGILQLFFYFCALRIR